MCRKCNAILDIDPNLRNPAAISAGLAFCHENAKIAANEEII
jgi:hypothetical protein